MVNLISTKGTWGVKPSFWQHLPFWPGFSGGIKKKTCNLRLELGRSPKRFLFRERGVSETTARSLTFRFHQESKSEFNSYHLFVNLEVRAWTFGWLSKACRAMWYGELFLRSKNKQKLITCITHIFTACFNMHLDVKKSCSILSCVWTHFNFRKRKVEGKRVPLATYVTSCETYPTRTLGGTVVVSTLCRVLKPLHSQGWAAKIFFFY